MCGIAGLQVAPGDKALRTGNKRRALVAELLRGIESRGRDASGVAWRDGKGRIWIQKDAVPASHLARHLDTEGTMTTAIAHARFATQGSPSRAGNNHPVQVDTYIGVHNGVCRNDDDLFRLLADHAVEREAEVDTEAIFALLRYGARAFPDASENRAELLSLVEGSAALAWVLTEDNKDTLYLARGSGSPLWIGRTPGGSLVFASTKAILTAAAKSAGVTLKKVAEVKEGTAIKARNGRPVTVQRFVAANGGVPYRTPNYRRPSAYEWETPARPLKGKGAGRRSNWPPSSSQWSRWDEHEVVRRHQRAMRRGHQNRRTLPGIDAHMDAIESGDHVDGWPAWDDAEV